MNRKKMLPAAYFSAIFLLLSALTFGQATAAVDSYWSITPEPHWGSQARLPAPDKTTDSAQRSGKTYHIVESHHNYADTSDQTTYYKRIVYQINNTSGLESSEPISIEYDPVYERVEFHQVRVHRNGEIIDQLLQGEKVQQLQRETQLDDGLYDGHETLHLILDDQRVGDTVEYSYSIIGANPVYDNHVFGWNKMQAGAKVGSWYFRLRYPETKNVNTKVYSGTLAVDKITTDNYHQLTWVNQNTEAATYQSDVPSSFLATTYIQYSDFSDWQQVGNWAAPMYTLPAKATGQVRSTAFEIKKSTTETKAQIEEVIRFVQDEVQYTGMNAGVGGYLPDAPESILQRRFGDCKDKSILITALLQELGVTALPSLVHTSNGTELGNYLPSPDVFDHMIVKLLHDGKTYWVDGTKRLQGSTLESLQQASYQAALVPAEANSGLQHYTVNQSLPSQKIIDEKYTLAENHSEHQSRLRITTTLHGSEAESMRRTLQSDGTDAIEQDYLDFYKQEFGTVEIVAKMHVDDDRAANTIILTESYLIDDIWQPDDDATDDEPQHIIKLNVDEVYHALKIPNDKRRFQPIEQRHPVDIEYRAVVHDDTGWASDDTNMSVDNKYFSYQSNAYAAGKVLILTYKLKTKESVVSVDDSKAYIRDLKDMLTDTGYYFYYTPSVERQQQNSNGFGDLISTFSNWILENQRPPQTDKVDQISTSTEHNY